MKRHAIVLLVISLPGCTVPSPAESERTQAATAEAPNGPFGDDIPDWIGVRWTNGVIPYVYDEDGTWPKSRMGCVVEPTPIPLTPAMMKVTDDAIAAYEQLTPLRFKKYSVDNPPDPERPYVVFTYSSTEPSASSSMRGMSRDGRLASCVFIGPNILDDAFGHRIMLHEIGHVFGFAHEQQRLDRETYMVFDAKCAGTPPPAKIYAPEPQTLALTPYDFDSIMQYKSDNGCRPNCPNDGGPCPFPIMLRKLATEACVPTATCTCSEPPVAGDCRWIDAPPELSVHDVNALHRMYERALGTDDPNDALGAAMAVGDFDDDGYLDLAVGAPGDGPRGAVYLWKGTAGSAPGTLGRLVAWTTLKPSAAISALSFSKSHWGAALAAGDFDGDGATDLAIGAPGDDNGLGDGSVVIFYSRSIDLSPRRRLVFGRILSQFFLALPTGGHGDEFGASLAVADFDADGKHDLAIGVPRKVVDGKRAGEVVLMMSMHDQVGVVLSLAGTSANQNGNRFGASLVAARLNRDGDDSVDLAIGSPEAGTPRSGAVYLYSNRPGGFILKDTLRPGDPAPDMRFGAALAVGGYDGTITPGGFHRATLAVGAPRHNLRVVVGDAPSTVEEAGLVYLFQAIDPTKVIYGEMLRFREINPGPSHHFGEVLATYTASSGGGTDTSKIPDALLAGVPDHGAGVVSSFYWSFALDHAHQIGQIVASPGGLDPLDRYGAAVASGNFYPSLDEFPGSAEIVVGAPGRNSSSGVVFVDNLSQSEFTRLRQSTQNPE